MDTYISEGRKPVVGDRVEVVGRPVALYQHHGKAGTVVEVERWTDDSPLLQTDVKVRVDGEPTDARPCCYYPNELRPI